MKKIVTFILIIFALAQVVPAVQSFFTGTPGIVFTIDEEKGSEKSDTEEKKDKKEYTGLNSFSKLLAENNTADLHSSQNILASPFLEKPTPPPNFC